MFTFEEEQRLLDITAWSLIASGVVTFVLLIFLAAPYGRYSTNALAPYFGFTVSGKFAWVFQEAPCLWVAAILIFLGNNPCLADHNNLSTLVLLSMFLVHYTQRTCVFPFLIRQCKDCPFGIFFMAFSFCCVNGWLQSAFLLRHHCTSPSKLEVWHPQFILGSLLFIFGFVCNLHADHVLRNLRKTTIKATQRYSIPYGGMFKYVSAANYFGEIMEWCGYAVAMNNFVGVAFAFFTFCNIGPRGRQHHQWYLNVFKEQNYSKLNRKAVIPFLW